jgi:hypothetical protein
MVKNRLAELQKGRGFDADGDADGRKAEKQVR